jgi:uncharacterized protein (TIGR00725 family)
VAIKKASFLGGADFVPGDDTYQAAFETARLLAENGLIIVNGGGPGVMRASTEGAHAAHGHVVGVTYYPAQPHPKFEGRDPLNRFDEEVVTSDYFQRTKTALGLGDVHVVFRGGTGTISEFGMSWALSRIHYGHNIPILLFGGFWEEITDCLRKHMYMRADEFVLYRIVTSPQEVLKAINELDKGLGAQDIAVRERKS